MTVRYLMVPGTLDEDMNELIESKRSVLHAVLNQGKLLDEDIDIRKELAQRLEARTTNGKRKRKKSA